MQRCTEMSSFLGGCDSLMTNTDVFGAGVKDVGLPVGQGRKRVGEGLEIQHSNFSMQIRRRPFLHIFVSWFGFF